MSLSYYELLDVSTGATEEEIRAAFERAVGREQVKGARASGPSQSDLTEAMEILTDPDLRKEYDRILAPTVAPVQLAMNEVLAGTEASHPPTPVTPVTYLPRITRELPVVEAPESARKPDSAEHVPEGSFSAKLHEGPGVQPLPVEPVKGRISKREFELAQQLVEETAIANAEAALAQVAAKVREVKAVTRGRRPEIPPDARFNGELLRKVRESRSLSVKQLADRTRVSSRHLENIEADRYAELPANVYLRGILMNLARELRLDPLRVARTYLELVSAATGRSN